MKRLICIVSIMMLCLMGSTASAYEYPKGFWSVNEKYEAAMDAENYPDVIRYGKDILTMMKNEPDCYETRQIIASRYKELAVAYTALYDTQNAKYYFGLLESHIKKYEPELDEWYEALDIANAHYQPEIKMYTDKGTPTYYGAKNEKKNGVLFGVCSNGEIRPSLDNESMVLTYQELGQKLISYNVGIMKEASSEGLAVEFALNCPNEGDDIRNFSKKKSYLKEISELFDEYSNVPIYLRFAAEFDIWENTVDAKSYKEAFRYVSDYFKDRNSNVAIVWSPNQVSSYDINIDDYYPGDEYVDWVGMSSYAVKYHMGNKSQDGWNSMVFKAGENSSPVIAVKNIVEKYGDRKPIMISESGSGHKVYTYGEDTTDFALQNLREYYYYLPMVYPQIKLMAHFDYYMEEEDDDFRLSNNSTLKKEYLKLTKGDRFIQDKYKNNTDYCYREITGGTAVEQIFPVSSYVHLYEEEIHHVSYYINDVLVGASYEIPFSTYIDARNYTGTHTLKAVATGVNGTTVTTESQIVINNTSPNNISVRVSSDRVKFDQEPVLYNDRTMVPMRKIFEELGATVTWDANTKTASGKRGDRTVRLTIGSKEMYVNSKKIELDTPAMILSDRTLVPVRAVAEGMGCDVDWDGDRAIVYIEPKVFKWSDWETSLPSDVDSDLFYIEEKEQYSYREKEYYETRTYEGPVRCIKTDTFYDGWSEWQSAPITETDTRDVETRTVSEPKRYHYAHYCTGNISDTENRYRTWDRYWHDECTYHDLGWFDSPLPYSEDSTSDYSYYVDGKKYRCSSSCYRWYLVETTGGDTTEYRWRVIQKIYTYWQWGDWSKYDDDYPGRGSDIEVRERTLYRYKEK